MHDDEYHAAAFLGRDGGWISSWYWWILIRRDVSGIPK